MKFRAKEAEANQHPHRERNLYGKLFVGLRCWARKKGGREREREVGFSVVASAATLFSFPFILLFLP